MIKGIIILLIILGIIRLIQLIAKDYYNYKLKDINSGYTLPEWDIIDAIIRIIRRK